MSDVGIRGDGASQIFKPVTLALMIAIGVVGFFGALVLGTYAPDLEGNVRTGGHAASQAAIGFSGLVRLAEATGRNPHIIRDEAMWASDDLVIATPEDAATKLNGIVAARGMKKPTLYVLPKWDAAENRKHKGWVQINGLLPVFEPEGVLAPETVFGIKRHTKPLEALSYVDDLPQGIVFTPPDKLQIIVPLEAKGSAQAGTPTVTLQSDGSGDGDGDDKDASDRPNTFDDLNPLITDGSGGIVLAEMDNMFILSDPDLLDNAGMKDRGNADSALKLLDWLNTSHAKGIGFDVVLNGLGQGKSVLRLAFDPPFLAMTLTLAAMVLLLGIRAAGRFGAPRARARAIAFGKAALVDNGALLVSKARKARLLGGRYAEVIREQAVRAFGVSPRFKPAEIDQYLDGLGQGVRFTELAHRAEAADNDSDMLAAARALHIWKREIVRDD